jgi:hypothetical protein
MRTNQQLGFLEEFETSRPPNPRFCHQEFLERLAEHGRDALGRRAAFLMQRLSVDARRLHYKATAGINRGWRRSRLCGSQGSHFYAWWAPQNALPLKESGEFSDAPDGKFLRATPFVEKRNWASEIDSNGRPVLSGRIPSPEGTNICPGIDGATNWFSPSYNPDTGLFYVMALESCNLFMAKPKEFVKGETFYNTGTTLPPGERQQKKLLALSVADGKVAWSYPQIGQGNSWGGTLTTAGGLVFFGDDSESFEAVEARTGRVLWHFNTGQVIRGSPMSYAVSSVQYVAIAAGSDIFCFSLIEQR